MIRMHIRLNLCGDTGAEGGQARRDSAAPITDAEHLDLLISRIADGEAGDADWREFSALGERSPMVWRTLAEAQRQHGALSVAVGVALHAADRSELPSRAGAMSYAGSGHEASPMSARVRTWGGWAVAAVLAVAFLSGQRLGLINARPNSQGPLAAGVLPAGWTSDNAADAYLTLGKKEGRVYGELPQRLLVETRPLDAGGYEVTYVRQFVEKARVNDLMRFGVDESGRMVPLRVVPRMTPGAPE